MTLNDPMSKARFAELGASLLPGSPADFGKLMRPKETEKWGKVVKFCGAKAVRYHKCLWLRQRHVRFGSKAVMCSAKRHVR